MDLTPSQKLILEAFRNLKYPAVYYDDAPEGRFACYIFLKPDGFVWLEPGYQSPTEPFSRIRSIDCPLSLKGGCIVFDGGWIGEGDAEEGKLAILFKPSLSRAGFFCNISSINAL